MNTFSLFQESNSTVSVANTLSGHITLAERLNYEERTRYLVLVQANVSENLSTSAYKCKHTLLLDVKSLYLHVPPLFEHLSA